MTNGDSVPSLAFGTWPLTGGEASMAVGMALDAGYRHIDTAQIYGNEREVGEAIRASGLDRTDIFVTTKVGPDNLAPERFLPSVERSLADLGIEAADLLLIHWPPRSSAALDAALDGLAEAHARGLARMIGVSNFTIAQMERAVALVPLPIAVNQVEFHPLLDQSKLLEAARRLGIRLFAYASLVRGEVFRRPALAEIARRKGVGIAELTLAWTLHQGVGGVTMTTKRENAAANLRAATLSLSDAEMAAITKLTAENLRIVSPGDWAPDWD